MDPELWIQCFWKARTILNDCPRLFLPHLRPGGIPHKHTHTHEIRTLLVALLSNIENMFDTIIIKRWTKKQLAQAAKHYQRASASLYCDMTHDVFREMTPETYNTHTSIYICVMCINICTILSYIRMYVLVGLGMLKTSLSTNKTNR